MDQVHFLALFNIYFLKSKALLNVTINIQKLTLTHCYHAGLGSRSGLAQWRIHKLKDRVQNPGLYFVSPSLSLSFVPEPWLSVARLSHVVASLLQQKGAPAHMGLGTSDGMDATLKVSLTHFLLP